LEFGTNYDNNYLKPASLSHCTCCFGEQALYKNLKSALLLLSSKNNLT